MLGTKKTYTVTEGELVAMLKIGAQEGSIEKQERERAQALSRLPRPPGPDLFLFCITFHCFSWFSSFL